MSDALDQHAETLAKLTTNAVLTLHRQHARPGSQAAGTDTLLRDTYTGPGKWTTLAMLGVHNNLRKAGCIEKAGHGERITTLGLALASAISLDVQAALRMCRAPKQ